MSTSPSKNTCGGRDLSKGAIDPKEMAEIVRQLEEAKIRERQRAGKENPPKQTQPESKARISLTPNKRPNPPSRVAYAPLARDSDPGPPPPAPTRSTFKFCME